MAKIIAKASLVQNSNLFLHIADFGADDVSIVDDTGGVYTLTSTADIADWSATGAADADGVIKRGLVAGDEVTLSHMGNSADEGKTATVDSISTNALTISDINGVAGTLTVGAAGTGINVLATKKTFQFVEAGGLDFQDGVQGLILASKLVDMWDTLDLDVYYRPFTSIEPRAKSIAAVYGWEGHDADTIAAIRDTAMEYRANPTAVARKIYALWRSGDLHNVGDRQLTGDQFYFWPSSDADATAPTAAVMKGSVNQLFLIYDADGADNRFTNGGITWYTRCAQPLKTIVMEEHEVTYAEIMPVSAANGLDPKLTVDDASGAPYDNVNYTNNSAVQAHDVNSVSYDFDAAIDADVATSGSETNEVVHNRINWELRQTADMNNGDGGSMRGDKQWPITAFSGDIFTVQGYLIDYNATQRNNLRVVDDGGTTRQWPATLAITVTSGALGVGGEFSIYHKDTFGTSDATIFQDETPTDMVNQAISGSDQIIMAFSSYAVDGHTPGEDLDIVIAYNNPGSIEPDTTEVTLDGANVTVALPLTADPSYTAA